MSRPLRVGPARMRDRWRALAGAVSGLCAGAALSGCALPVQAEMDQAAEIARFATRYDHVVGSEATVLDRALAECPDKTAAAETACLRERLSAAASTPRALAALVPHCRAGTLCRYDATTRNRRGFVAATATDFVRHWRVEIDLRRPGASVAAVPVRVIDRDDFEAPAAPAASPSGAQPQG